ncbi:emp24/gp25L/p24 family protein [Dickeya sp. ws52]|uniref:emp24/gp25L/p24 family protein n=1 Tax=Dickeya sp. ws52 TaxID=2576377 RepID=UPI0011805E58|nr:emp24/gp25L/p24 family protein [Dickeya sp. ws52]TYL42806.1 emp24/gp25L/p24 family protein [Dickeya sp. ws52]
MKLYRTGLFFITAGLTFSLGSAMAETTVPVEVKDTNKLPNKGVISLFKAPDKIQQKASDKYQFTKSEKDGVIVITPDVSAPKAAAKNKSLKSLSSSQAATSDSTFTPLCPTLAVNSIYTLSGLQNGGSACYHFEITQPSKTTTFVTGMSSGTNVSLTLFSDDGKNNLTPIYYSDNPENSDEATLNLTKPGHYYWYIEANTADGSELNFGAIVNTNIDSYELNDAPSLATVVPDGLYRIKGNSDSDVDVDYYTFTAISGQQVLLQLVGADNAANNYWLIAYSTDDGNTWVTSNTGQQNTITPSKSNEIILVRVSPNPAKLPTPTQYYQLSFGSKIASFTNSVKGESSVLNIPYSAPTPYGSMTTQAYRTVTWNVRLADSTGAGIPNVDAVLYLDQRAERQGDKVILKFNPSTAHVITTDASGNASGTITLDTCYADSTTEFNNYDRGYLNTWSTTFDFGAWRLEVPIQEGIGVGGNNVQYVTFGHICKQTLVRSVKS